MRGQLYSQHYFPKSVSMGTFLIAKHGAEFLEGSELGNGMGFEQPVSAEEDFEAVRAQTLLNCSFPRSSKVMDVDEAGYPHFRDIYGKG